MIGIVIASPDKSGRGDPSFVDFAASRLVGKQRNDEEYTRLFGIDLTLARGW